MRIPMFQVDAFAEDVFAGNPAAVCVLDSWPSDDLMAAVAAENNLSETAFLVAAGTADEPVGLRWFTPTVEVDLCGHATLAAGHVVLDRLHPEAGEVRFDTRSGELRVSRGTDGMLAVDLPARAVTAPLDHPPTELVEALGARPARAHRDHLWTAVFDSANEVAALEPDHRLVAGLDVPWVIATAPGELGSGTDFVLRYFAAGSGIDEDPVTGSALCVLGPYWAARLGRTQLVARQISARGGRVECEVGAERVVLRGRCADYLEGWITVPG